MEKEILDFRIDAFTRDTLPMARLAEYMAALATLYGSRERVHFEKLRKGSTILQVAVESTVSQAVISRLLSAKSENASEEVRRAYLKIDSMLRDNQATGEIKRKDGAKILVFPGRKAPTAAAIIVSEHAEVDGIVVRVGGVDNTIPVHIQAPSKEVYPCEVRNRVVARELAALLYGDPIRVRGPGRWERSSEGAWKLISMTIEGWDVLDVTPIDELFERLRTIPGNGWHSIEDVDAELKKIRYGE